MNTRRKLVIALGAGALAAPFALCAQQLAKPFRIGFLVFPSSSSNARFAAFKQGMRDLGYVEGKNFVIDYRSAEGNFERFPALITELVKLQVDVIVADDGTPTVLAAKKVTRTIPIVFSTVADPVAQGIVESLARPGGNVTGLSLQSTDTSGKRLEFLKQIVPGAKRFAFLANPSNASATPTLRELETAAKILGVELLLFEVRSVAEFDHAFDEIARKRMSGLVILDDPMLTATAELSRIVTLAAKLKLPTIGGNSLLPDVGGFASYGPNRLDLLRRTATYVDKILKGAKPADLPVEQPTKYDLVVNLKTAKAFGIKVPDSILVQATKVIE
jgi:putative ABC transport system substrate-binding protein